MWMLRRSSLEAHGASSLLVLRVISASLWGQWFVALELKEPSLLTCLGAKHRELGVFSHTLDLGAIVLPSAEKTSRGAVAERGTGWALISRENCL